MVTLYNVVSADWFITDKDGEEDFIPDGLWPKTLELMQQFDAIVLSSKAYEAIQAYAEELLGSFNEMPVRKIVVSNENSYTVAGGYELMTSPEEAVRAKERVLVCSGETMNNYLLSRGLIDEIIFHQLPDELGEGKPVFDNAYDDRLELRSDADLGLARELRFAVRR